MSARWHVDATTPGFVHPGGPRPSTPDVELPGGGRRMAVHRACNGCGRDIGDADDEELLAAIAGRRLPDVREECGCRG